MPPKPQKYVEETSALTGLPCAGCGSQRAIHALLDLDLAEAIRYNFLLVAILPFLELLIFSSFFRKRFLKLYLATHHAYVAYSIFAIIMLWWVLRIVLGWYVWSVNPTQYIYSREIVLQPHQARNLYQP